MPDVQYQLIATVDGEQVYIGETADPEILEQHLYQAEKCVNVELDGLLKEAIDV